MFGVFFEDINFGADGGLYPELIKNRSFEFDQELAGWHAILPITPKGDLAATRGELILRTDEPLNASNPHYLRMHAYVPGYGDGTPAIAASASKAARNTAFQLMCAAAARRAYEQLSRMDAIRKLAAEL